MDRLVGFSLSFCVADILRGKVDESQVEGIFANTLITTPEEFDRVAQTYCKIYWDSNEEGIAIMRRFWDTQKILQCGAIMKHNIHPSNRWAVLQENLH